MTRDEIVAIVKQRMGNYNGAEIDTHIVTEMKLNQIAMEQEAQLPWFLIEVGFVNMLANKGTAGPLVTLRGAVSCPFLAEYELGVASYKLQSETYLKESVLEKKLAHEIYFPFIQGELTATDSKGRSLYYASSVNTLDYFLIIAPPSEDYNFYVGGYYADVPLDTDITNLWLTYAPDLVIAKVGLVIAGQYTALEKFVPLFTNQVQEAEKRLAKKNTIKEEAHIRNTMGDA